MEIGVAEASSRFVGRERERDLNSRAVEQSGFFYRPFQRAGEAVRGTRPAIGSRAKPREDHGHTAANRLAGHE